MYHHEGWPVGGTATAELSVWIIDWSEIAIAATTAVNSAQYTV